MVRVVIADDHQMLVDGLEATLTGAGLDVVGTTGNGAAVAALVEATRPDVVLLDLELPGRSGYECLREIRERTPSAKVIILSGSDDHGAIDRALDLGAVCFIGKGVDPGDLAAMIRILATGQPIYQSGSRPSRPAQREISRTAAIAALSLTGRELEVVRLAIEGYSNAQLAKRLWVTQQTVKFHLSNVYRKLDVENRTQAAAKLRSLGFQEAADATASGPAHRTATTRS